jgi:hypothetical protein
MTHYSTSENVAHFFERHADLDSLAKLLSKAFSIHGT